MTSKELLNPRYLVLAEYPNCIFKKGTIIEKWHFGDWFIESQNKDSDILQLHKIEPYPHLFKKLNWWEHRSVEDMPMKLVSNMPHNKGEIKFVESWELDKLLVMFNSKKRQYSCFMDWDSENCYLPKD